MEKNNLSQQAKDLLRHHLPLIMDRSDWNHAYGLIDMAEGLGLLTSAEARDFKAAADVMREPKAAQEKVSDRIAITEAIRKTGGCGRMIYGDYVGNNVRCQTCLKDCDHAPIGKPSAEAISDAKLAIAQFREREACNV